MYFMGAIGFRSNGSGLQELFDEGYSGASVIKMMTSYAYSIALRDHILTRLALTKMILAVNEITEEEESAVLLILVNFISQSKSQSTVIAEMASLLKKFNNSLGELETRE